MKHSTPGHGDERQRGGAVTWRLELLRGWGERLDPTWLPTGDTDGWRRIFEAEDLAGRVFAAGGAGLRWAQLAEAAAGLTCVLEQYRLQWRVAEYTAVECPVRSPGHLAAMAVPAGLRPPRRMRPDGRWRLRGLDGARAVSFGEYVSADLAEGAAVAARTGAADHAYWAEPAAAGPRPPAAANRGWTPRVDTDLRLVAFAAEESVTMLCAAATTGHTGPDVLGSELLCRLGLAAHQMIKEYRTLFRAAWTDLEACKRSTEHDEEAEALLAEAPEAPARGPGGRWRHMLLVDGSVRVVSKHDGLAAAGASVAALRAVDECSVRWAEPVAAAQP